VTGRSDGADAYGLPFPTGHEQMEQGGTPAVLLHLVGRKITDDEFVQVNLKPDKFHGEWN
jgi:hypothetical protein